MYGLIETIQLILYAFWGTFGVVAFVDITRKQHYRTQLSTLRDASAEDAREAEEIQSVPEGVDILKSYVPVASQEMAECETIRQSSAEGLKPSAEFVQRRPRQRVQFRDPSPQISDNRCVSKSKSDSFSKSPANVVQQIRPKRKKEKRAKQAAGSTRLYLDESEVAALAAVLQYEQELSKASQRVRQLLQRQSVRRI